MSRLSTKKPHANSVRLFIYANVNHTKHKETNNIKDKS